MLVFFEIFIANNIDIYLEELSLSICICGALNFNVINVNEAKLLLLKIMKMIE